MNERRIQSALISVSDKSGIVEFARVLAARNIEIISTGGTLKTLREAGIAARSVSDVTGFPEILDGRVKTLHPAIHAGLLAVSANPEHMRQIGEQNIAPIDMVVINLYPFEKTVAASGVTLDTAIEQIDIGGPAMLRAAAKNFKDKTVVTRPAQYGAILEELERLNGAVSEETRFQLARETFLHTAAYDGAISSFLDGIGENKASSAPPEKLVISLRKAENLRYGENPHQSAALYGTFGDYFEKLHGKELSYNNIVDIQAAAWLVAEFAEPTVAIIKHTNPCGVGSAATLADAYRFALATDAKSAFGGIVCMNRPLDMATAQLIDAVFTEVIIAPGYSDEVLASLRRKKDRRIIRQHGSMRHTQTWDVKSVAGGFLVQTPDEHGLRLADLRIVTERRPESEDLEAMFFAWRVAKHVKSNAIVYARAGRTLGIGAGQMSRVDSSRIAAQKAQDAGLDLRGCAVASDAFFPFADGLLEAVKVGATAVIQPGGSVRDEEVIAAADEHGIVMAFTGVRHFRH